MVIEHAPKIDLSRTDGGLPPLSGVDNIEVLRASRARPDLAEGKGYTYNHHPDLAVWHGRFYVGWDSGEKDEDTWPARELYSTSRDGREWTAPAELFPQGLSTPTRLYFYHAHNGRMLAFAGLRIDHSKTDEDTKGPMIVREIAGDHQLGPVFTLRAPAAGSRREDPPDYATAGDPAFVAACRELRAARVALETQDNGVFLDADKRSRWHDAGNWPGARIGNGFWKAPSFFHRTDGTIVGIGKSGWTSLSADEGLTWSKPVVPPTLSTNNAKVWGQRTADGDYVLVYNPTPRPRYPLALVASHDGVTFGHMRAVQTRFTAQRYPGINKNPGLQYIRGVAEWATDDSLPDARAALWLVYSANKEDIWISRVSLPVGAPRAPRWNVYEPKWAHVTALGDDGVSFESTEPFDCAEASRDFAAAAHVVFTFKVSVPSAGYGATDIHVQAPNGARVVQLRLAGDGYFRGLDRDKLVEFGRYAAGSTLEVRLEVQAGARGQVTVAVNGAGRGQAQFTEPAESVARLSFRAWADADADRRPEFLPATAAVGRDFDGPAPTYRAEVTGLTIGEP